METVLELTGEPTRASASSSEFVDAMSALASGVVLVTCRVGDRPWGMTVTTLASVSAEPPTILVSLGSDTASARAITMTRRFGVSILRAEQLAVARLGSEPGAAKFLEPFVDEGDAHSTSPRVADALAHLDCEVTQVVRVADHTIFIGRAHGAEASHGGAPLLYHRRAYRALPNPDQARRANERKPT